MRTEQVVTSFENRVKAQAIVMVDKPPGRVDWEKEMVRPESDYEEAVERLHHVWSALSGLASCLTPYRYQRLMEKEGNEREAFSAYEARLTQGASYGHLAVETAMKALIHLSASPEAQPWGHDINKLLPQLHEPHKTETETRLAAGLKHLQNWQEQDRYERYVTPTPEGFTHITETACQTALYTANRFDPGQEIATRTRNLISFIEHQLESRDLHTGQHRTPQEET